MIFPLEMKSAMKNPAVKKAFILDRISDNYHMCKNCAGEGYLHLFLATNGPFPNSPQGVAHWDNGWWKGETFSFACPVCGNGAKSEKEIVDLNEPEVKEIHFLDYTDK